MRTLLFIPSLLAGDIDGFMVKIAVVVLLWLVDIAASMLDLVTGIAASKRTGVKHTSSWGLRRTLSKDLQYLAMLAMMLVIDICLSALSPHVALFGSPLLSIIGTTAITIVEAISVAENMRKGKSKEEDKLDEIQQLVVGTIDALGSEKTKQLIQALQKQIENKKS